ncbi:16S rRNA (guanine(966)-N(2))-methyltransferase RsmD [Acidovorax sp. FJL06]|uniref:16S rRNA (guanine(966)-N(2))-methyltransferase RsmD n=1 Tax=Acidovorax sp. FJL06 TaxID=2153365 RepID=UPI000F57E56F|nr:16S rRNA (guanine(966)-N(2))-methyltransferase RsmD [Acidovorax sp. FJL06]RQO83982.1 16S rRNA (guanine(966)-N(2))-methyltransferase RsmD [Acidovorax sp. FJL06]
MSRSTLRGSAINAEIRKAQAAAAAPAAPKKSPKDKPAAAAPKGAGEIRIIGGQWKRTRLPVAQRPGLRPTPDRVRETLFNWLGQDLSGWRCLDAFAGTGALGFEAASRGAAAVQLVESDAALVAQLQVLQAKLQASAVRVQRGDGVAALKQAAPASVDLVLLDPPFDGDLFAPALQAAAKAVAAEGFIYLEAPRAWTDEELAASGLVLHRHLKAGAVHAHLLKRA